MSRKDLCERLIADANTHSITLLIALKAGCTKPGKRVLLHRSTALIWTEKKLWETIHPQLVSLTTIITYCTQRY